jgi:hypothetical protein
VGVSKDEQKREIENYVQWFLEDHPGELLHHQRYFLAEALSHVVYGRFGMAYQSLSFAYEEAKEFRVFKMERAVVMRATREALERALRYLKPMPAQEYPVWR